MVTSVTAVTVAERGPGSNSDSSPNIWPGPRIASRFSRPSLEVRPSLTLPSETTNSRSPASPSRNSTSPRRILVWVIDARSAEAASSSRALNSGA
jgi:hypothetical protein